jgi:hypothetical protein
MLPQLLGPSVAVSTGAQVCPLSMHAYIVFDATFVHMGHYKTSRMEKKKEPWAC